MTLYTPDDIGLDSPRKAKIGLFVFRNRSDDLAVGDCHHNFLGEILRQNDTHEPQHDTDRILRSSVSITPQ